MDIVRAKGIFDKYKRSRQDMISCYREPYDSVHPYRDIMGKGEEIIFSFERFMYIYVFTDIAVYYFDHFNGKKRREYLDIKNIYVDKEDGKLIIDDDALDLGSTLSKDDIIFYRSLWNIVEEFKRIFNTPSREETGVKSTGIATSDDDGEIKIDNNMKEVFADKSYRIENNRYYADIKMLTDKDVMDAVSIFKNIYTFYVDRALEDGWTCCLRISNNTANNMLKKPYMRTNSRVIVSYNNKMPNCDEGFYITSTHIYLYAGNVNTPTAIPLSNINRFIIYGNNGLYIHINDENYSPVIITKDKDAVAMLLCTLLYAKSEKGIYSLIHQIENFAKVNAVSAFAQFAGTYRLRRNDIDRMGGMHSMRINPVDCLASITSQTTNALLTIDGLYIYAAAGNAPVQIKYINGKSIRKASASIERMDRNSKTKKTARVTGWIIGGPVGGMIGGWVGGAMTKNNQYYIIEINNIDRLIMDTYSTFNDIACMTLILNVYSNIVHG